MDQQAFQEVLVRIPKPLRYQLVYRLRVYTPFYKIKPFAPDFVYCQSIRDAFPVLPSLLRCFSFTKLCKLLMKLSTPRREFYLTIKNHEVVHHGWVMIGRCRYYRVEPNSAVIGPIWTAPSARNLGIGTQSLQQAIDTLISRGVFLFYIDTSDDNLPCQKLIAKCGFGPPVAVYIRGEEL